MHAYRAKIQSRFSRKQSLEEKFLFYIFYFFFHVEAPPFRLYYQLPTILYIPSNLLKSIILSNRAEMKPEINEWADIFQIVSTELKSFLLTRLFQIFDTIWIRNVTGKVQMAETLTTIINAILFTSRFTWRSPKFAYCVMSIFGSSMMTIFNILRIVATGVNSTKMSKIFQDILPIAFMKKYLRACDSFNSKLHSNILRYLHIKIWNYFTKIW